MNVLMDRLCRSTCEVHIASGERSGLNGCRVSDISTGVRPSYACRVCERVGNDPQVVRPPLPPEPIPRGTAAAGLLAHVIVSKYVDHLPLYRQESILGRLGWEVTRSTLCDQIIACAGVLTPSTG